jgi:hypothetical protein
MENNNAYNGEDLQDTWVILDLKQYVDKLAKAKKQTHAA